MEVVGCLFMRSITNPGSSPCKSAKEPERTDWITTPPVCSLAAVAGFSRWGDLSTPTWRTLSDNSFGVYYVHPLLLYPGAWLLVSLTIPGALKAVVLLAVTVALSLAISACILRRAPILRRMF